VTLSKNAKTYATGQNIPASVKGKKYTIQQIGSGKVLLKEILSWVKTADVTGGSTSTSKPAPKPKSSGIKSLGKIKIVGVSSAAIIMDAPDRNKAKNVGTIAKGKTIDISGSVKGKNNPKGYWEVIH